MFALATVVRAGDDPTAAGRGLAPFLSVAPVVGRHAELLPYADVVAATRAPHRGQQSGRTHSGLAVHLDGKLSERLGELARAGFGELLQIRSVGGAINDVPADATAYAHRHQNFSITAVAPYASQEFDDAWAAVHPSLDGLYLSFESAFTPERLAEAFPGTTLQRLRGIKKQIDPDNVFHQNFPVAMFRPSRIWVSERILRARAGPRSRHRGMGSRTGSRPLRIGVPDSAEFHRRYEHTEGRYRVSSPPPGRDAPEQEPRVRWPGRLRFNGVRRPPAHVLG